MAEKVTQKVAHPQSISKMLHIRDRSHRNQSIDYNKESSDWCLHNPKVIRDFVEIDSECATYLYDFVLIKQIYNRVC